LKGDKGNDCLVSCDGVDFKIPEHGPNFSSHKFAKKSGLRYEICICILTGDIVWVNGPYPCGKFPDVSVFRESLKSHLADGERVEADDGYIGEHPECIKCPKGFHNPEETKFMQSRVHSRQETVNKRFKDWGILRQRYRHDITEHGDYARAVFMLTQLAIDNGEKLFSTGYRDPPYTNTAYDVEDSDDDDDL
jgi:DDE superfamily endonuclease